MIKLYNRFISIKTKIGVVIGLSTFVISSILIAYTTRTAREYAIQSAKDNAMFVAKDYAAQIKADVEKGLTSTKVLAQTLSGVKAETNPLSITREGVNSILKEVLVQNDFLYGSFTCWEPNAFDSLDENYRNFDAAHDTSGRFIPYWFKDNNKILFETALGYDTDPFYVEPRNTKKEIILDPVPYIVNEGTIHLITIVSPIINNGIFYGVAGVDVPVSRMQKMISEANIYEGKAQITVLSHDGTISATTIHDSLIGRNIKKVFPAYDQQITAMQQGVEGSVLSDSTLKVHAPIFVGDDKSPWQISVIIPSDLVMQEANAVMWKMIFISTSLLGFTVFIMLFLIKRMIKPLDAIVHTTERVAVGDLSYQAIEVENDEIGLMNKAFATLISGLQKTTDFANQIGKGNLEAEFDALGEKDVLGNALISMRHNLKIIAEEDRKRNWTTEGLALFGDILRGNLDDFSLLSDNIIASLVKYLNANQGCMFVITEEGDDKFLELAALYAWDRKRIRGIRMDIHDGLAGQAVLEKDYIYLTDVPQDYIKITSGLGEANPTSVLVMPLKINEEVMGVIELASFNEFKPYQIEFVAKVGENIASTLSTARINQTTRRLLEEAKLASEEKRAAEEQLLQNQEELQATQEELQRTIATLQQENKLLQHQLNQVATH